MKRQREPIKHSTTSEKLTAMVAALYNGKISFSIKGTQYTFNDIQHLQNTVNKIRRDEFNRK